MSTESIESIVSIASRLVPDRERAASWLLLTPLLALLLFVFLVPVGLMLSRSFYAPVISQTLPDTLQALRDWTPSNGPPPETAYTALHRELRAARAAGTVGAVGRRLSERMPDASELISATTRQLSGYDRGPWREVFYRIDPRWIEPDIWNTLRAAGRGLTADYFFQALDFERGPDSSWQLKPASRRVQIPLLLRTVSVSVMMAFLSVVAAYPLALWMRQLPARRAMLVQGIITTCLWTSVLARAFAWIALLQRQGVVNTAAVSLGLVADSNRLDLLYNMLGTAIVGTHILIPVAVGPIYSCMTTVSVEYRRAAISLGAHPFGAFWRVYFPLTLPGVGAALTVTVIFALGYYIVPALVGGTQGQFISRSIAFNVQESLNWGLAAALSVVLVTITAALYPFYVRLSRDRRRTIS